MISREYVDLPGKELKPIKTGQAVGGVVKG
jgi:hypothetical protein